MYFKNNIDLIITLQKILEQYTNFYVRFEKIMS